MSFFDLENELPGLLDGEIKKRSAFNEITSQSVINRLDTASLNSYHIVCADKGNMVGGKNKQYQIWKFQAPKGNIRAYGKYLEFKGANQTLEFWIGLVVQDKIMNLYLWFGTKPPQSVRQYLTSIAMLVEEIEKREYWYKIQPGNSAQFSSILTDFSGCGSPPLDKDKVENMKKEVTKAISELLDAVEQA